ncbi:hypothetical protein BofuT4_P011600.1 [Botrytis cinerea T4]|uniref:DUF7924 domain-containing protein n=1 Tax=Botryotinia fuckeliana (strain T4) TaxID=999810 RepID=G2XS47_BOTF4|nr:hypothetical protein BofuT4_P011600.1 [Botrytis cinerea T4]
MPPHQAKPDTRNVGQPSLQKDQGKTPQGIKRKRSHPPSRKSAQACPERAWSAAVERTPTHLNTGQRTTFYRHPIREFSFTERNGKEKWTAYKFTKNVYDIWMPNHLKRICSVIDSLPPNIGFEVGESGLSQGLENYQFSGYSNQGAESLPEEASSQASRISSREITCL